MVTVRMPRKFLRIASSCRLAPALMYRRIQPGCPGGLSLFCHQPVDPRSARARSHLHSETWPTASDRSRTGCNGSGLVAKLVWAHADRCVSSLRRIRSRSAQDSHVRRRSEKPHESSSSGWATQIQGLRVVRRSCLLVSGREVPGLRTQSVQNVEFGLVRELPELATRKRSRDP